MATIAPFTATLRDGRALLIRPLGPEDAQRMLDIMPVIDRETPYLLRAPGEFHYTLEQEERILRERLENPDFLWLAPVLDGEVVGSCEVARLGQRQKIRHRGYLAISLLKSAWSLGIGGLLTGACLDWARAQGMRQVELDVMAANTRAIALYERMGFVTTGRRPHAYHHQDGSYGDDLFMCCVLEA